VAARLSSWYTHANHQNEEAYRSHLLCNQSFPFWECSRELLKRAIEAYSVPDWNYSKRFSLQGFLIAWGGNSNSSNVSVATGCCKAVAYSSKILVPRLCKTGDDLFRGLSRDRYAGMNNVSPGVYARAFSCMFLEADPLRQHHPEGVVDPSYFVRGLAIGDHVAHHGFYWLQHFDVEPASRLPRSSFTPSHLAVNICEFIPSSPIRKNLPGELAAGLGRYTILKSKHNLLSCTPIFRFAEEFPNEGLSGPILYTLYL
jgi:hypothetical protein